MTPDRDLRPVGLAAPLPRRAGGAGARRGIEVTWVDGHLGVPAADRAQIDDLIAYLNGSAWPGMTATAARGFVPSAVGPPPAWHPNPEDPSTWRWWDGARWTSFTCASPTPSRTWFPDRTDRHGDGAPKRHE